jgi:hypothetical protein
MGSGFDPRPTQWHWMQIQTDTDTDTDTNTDTYTNPHPERGVASSSEWTDAVGAGAAYVRTYVWRVLCRAVLYRSTLGSVKMCVSSE